MLHTKLHPHDTQIFYRNDFSLRVILSGNNAHETSVSWNYTLSGYTPIIFWGVYLGEKYTKYSRESYWNFMNSFVTKVIEGLISSPDCVTCVASRDRQLLRKHYLKNRERYFGRIQYVILQK